MAQIILFSNVKLVDLFRSQIMNISVGSKDDPTYDRIVKVGKCRKFTSTFFLCLCPVALSNACLPDIQKVVGLFLGSSKICFKIRRD